MFVRVYIDQKKYTAVIEKGKTIDISVIKNISYKRETHIIKSNIDVHQDSWIVIDIG